MELLALAKGATPDSGGRDRPTSRGRLKPVVVLTPAQKRECAVTISYVMQRPTRPQTLITALSPEELALVDILRKSQVPYLFD